MTKLESELARWHYFKYGDVDVAKTFRKLGEEIGELGEALINGRDPLGERQPVESVESNRRHA